MNIFSFKFFFYLIDLFISNTNNFEWFLSVQWMTRRLNSSSGKFDMFLLLFDKTIPKFLWWLRGWSEMRISLIFIITNFWWIFKERKFWNLILQKYQRSKERWHDTKIWIRITTLTEMKFQKQLNGWLFHLLNLFLTKLWFFLYRKRIEEWKEEKTDFWKIWNERISKSKKKLVLSACFNSSFSRWLLVLKESDFLKIFALVWLNHTPKGER